MFTLDSGMKTMGKKKYTIKSYWNLQKLFCGMLDNGCELTEIGNIFLWSVNFTMYVKVLLFHHDYSLWIGTV